MDHAAVVVERGRGHIGIAHRGQGGEVLLLHLAWHFKLTHERLPDNYDLWVDSREAIEPERLRSVAASCRRIAQIYGDRRLPYGFSPPYEFFKDDGTFIPGPTRVGLTCATFVSAVFALAGIRLADLADWHVRPDDREWQENAVDELRRRGAGDEHVASVAREIGSVRIRPLEVAAAAAWHLHPAPFGPVFRLAEVMTRIPA